MKKTVIVLISIIAICAIILGIKVTNNNKNNESKYSRYDIIKLIENAKNYNNYYCEYNNLGENTIRKIKDNKMVVINDDRTVYIDYDSNKQTIIKNTENVAIVSSLDSSKLVSINKIYFQEGIDVLNDYDNYEYKFMKEEDINGFQCIKIKLTSQTINYDIWLDTKSGLVTKMICSKTEEDNKISIDYDLKLDIITDKDVETPKLNNYKVTEM